RGALDFDRPETRIVFDANRKIDRITPVIRNDAHKLIEECMIAANVAAAHFLTKHKLPALFRIHDGPQPDRVTELREFLGPLGLHLGGGSKPTPQDYEKVLSKLADRPDKYLIETVLLRSLSRAVYSPDNIGHFGLAHEQYLHFTSPIRRYPDLLVHRAMRHILRGGKAGDFHYTHKAMEALGQQTSMAEQRADEATREAVAWLKCDYMRDKVGEVFTGTITGVTGFGFFVELDDVFTEGLVHVSSLDNDYYRYEATGQRLVGERSGMEYRLTDRVKVKVANVNVDDRKIDFALLSKSKR
ncbi:MAG TPA: RNB domain-containing ribonuclease, partial [Gammaproteobacteria bacterium]|nr:RNB domain-containing ribonuclease [Gammaproteobacteria bacterium]